MTHDTQPDPIALLTSDDLAEREQGLALAPKVQSITLDGSTIEDLANANLLDQLPNLTTVTLTVGENTKSHLTAVLSHLQHIGVAADAVQLSGDFGGPEWLDARQYSWTKYFQVDEIEEYISECESGHGLQFTFGQFSCAPITDHGELADLVAQLPNGISGDDISFSRTNAGGSIYTCSHPPLKTVQFFWEEMNEESSEFDCCDWDQFQMFTKIIGDAGLSLSQGFFYNDWSGTQVDQEEWWIGEFEFPAATSITMNWTP
ncbi:MAG TPA: hypothetical protein DEB46_07870 [Myxococcales bacterium]|nr:hypothetical protein [Myxococcales bacterium]